MNRKPMTLTQKILADHAVGLTRPWVEAGDVLRIRVDWTIASELAWNGMDRTYQLLGRPPLHDKDRFFLAVDHTVDPDTLAHDPRTQRLVQLSQSFAKESGIRHFYDANQTILHTKFYRDLVQPGEVVLGADSHTSSHGGMGAFSIGLGGADVTAAMVLGETWIEVPEAIAVEYRGKLPFGLGGKDVILRTLGQLRRNTVAMERSVEYCGPAVSEFSTDVRFTIANMTAEFGGLNGIFEADGVVQSWLDQRRDHKDRPRYFRADPDAPYATRHRIDLRDLEPQVARPFSPDNAGNVTSAVGTRLDGAFIGACTTTEEELVLGALVLEQSLKYREAVPSEKRLVVPGSLEIQERLREHGLWKFYEKGGFKIDPPGCSMCLGIASRKAGKGELWLSSQNRNFENRMGTGSLAWLASAATVAASSVGMEIIDPRPLLAMIDQDRYLELLGRKGTSRVPELEAAEPAPALKPATSGAAAGHGPDSSALVRAPLQRFEDNVDTDAIIPGEFCHLTDLKELGQKAFRHVRPAFYQRAFCGMQVVVAGEGWGSGSSREQAVWALKGAGIKVIIARSFAFIHKRNLVNEGLPYLVVTDPAFYELAREGEELEVDLAAGAVRHVASGKTFSALSPSPIVQALRHEGGLVDAIKHHGPKVFEALAASTQ